MSEPTKRPWKLEAGRTFITEHGEFYLSYGKDKYGNPLFKDFCALDANADLICTAVNSYEAMREALENLVKPLENGWKVSDMAERIQEAKAALALAKKENPS